MLRSFWSVLQFDSTSIEPMKHRAVIRYSVGNFLRSCEVDLELDNIGLLIEEKRLKPRYISSLEVTAMVTPITWQNQQLHAQRRRRSTLPLKTHLIFKVVSLNGL